MVKRIVMAAALAALFFGLTSAVKADTFSIETIRTGTDMIDWGQLGAPFTTFGSPASWTSMGGAMGTVGDMGTQERRDEGTGWIGIFTLGDHLLWNQDNGNVIDVHFNTPITSGGAQIQDDFFGGYMGCVQALGSFGSSPIFCVSGDNTGAEDGSAPFIGIADLSGGNITDLLFTTDVGPNATAINSLSFTPGQVPQVPEPASLLMLGTGLLGLGGLIRRKLSA